MKLSNKFVQYILDTALPTEDGNMFYIKLSDENIKKEAEEWFSNVTHKLKSCKGEYYSVIDVLEKTLPIEINEDNLVIGHYDNNYDFDKLSKWNFKLMNMVYEQRNIKHQGYEFSWFSGHVKFTKNEVAENKEK